jgi:hypothetical protein
VYDVVRQHWSATLSLTLAAATFAVNGFARWRAVKSVGTPNWKLYFWISLPFVLFFVFPIAVKTVTYVRSAGEQPWWQYVGSLAEFMLKLGVPVLALLAIYILLGRVGGAKPPAPGPQPTPAAKGE